MHRKSGSWWTARVAPEDTAEKLRLKDEAIINAATGAKIEEARTEVEQRKAEDSRRASTRSSLESRVAQDLPEDLKIIRKGRIIRAFLGWKRVRAASEGTRDAAQRDVVGEAGAHDHQELQYPDQHMREGRSAAAKQAAAQRDVGVKPEMSKMRCRAVGS